MVEILTDEQITDYKEELQYFACVHGADKISPPYSAARKLVNAVKDWPEPFISPKLIVK